MPAYGKTYGAMNDALPPLVVEPMGVQEVLRRRAGATRRLLKLTGAALSVAFVSAWTGAHLLSPPPSSGSELTTTPTVSDLAGACDEAANAAVACFNGAGFKREWLLWKKQGALAAADVPAALNALEEEAALHRFDGVEPESLDLSTDEQQELGNIAALEATKNEQQVKAAPLEQAGVSEGGRRLTAGNINALTFSVGNAYTLKSGGYSSEYPWRHIAEPYRTTTLAVDSPVSGASYRWTVDNHVQGYGPAVEVLFQEVGYHTVVVERLASPTGAAAKAVSVKVMVKYVRREVRSLTDADREAWLSAVQVLQHVPTSAGQSLYGANYYSKDHFTRLHLYYGGAMDCDHWHQGAGFVTSHVALTLMWEQALQAVNPSVAAPYWDFTLDSTFYGSSDWTSSFIFSDDWFGEASPGNDLHTPITGRFAFVQALSGAAEYSDWINSYGVMRAPWNSDPTPFLTRSNNVYGYKNNMKPSGCKEYAIAVKKTTWMSMSKQLNAAAHGHIHELMGGSWNHYFKTQNSDVSSPAIYTFAHQIQALSKMLWRDGYVTCPATCDMATPAAACQCMADLDAMGNKPTGQILQEVGILQAVQFFDESYHYITSSMMLNDTTGEYKTAIDGYTDEESTHIYNRLYEMLANPGHLGDMYQATSTNDITFWLIHLTVDRLWHYKRLGNLANYDETWDPFHTCYGHNPRNVQPFKNLFGESGEGAFVKGDAERRRLGKAPAQTLDPTEPLRSSSADTYYTNMELYGLLHPASRELQYVYDNFNWVHCEETGHTISNLW